MILYSIQKRSKEDTGGATDAGILIRSVPGGKFRAGRAAAGAGK